MIKNYKRNFRGNVTLAEIAEKIKEAKSIVLTAHISPDGDALGSILAFYFMIKAFSKKENLEKKVSIVIADELPKYMKHFEERELIKNYDEFKVEGMSDLFISLDCANQERYGKSVEIKKLCKESINIDDVILNRFEVEKLLENSEVIVPKRRKYYIETLYSHYEHTFDGSHLDLARKMIKMNNPEYLSSFDKVMKQRSGCMFNMFIMKKELADNYFSWLFPILDSMYESMDLSDLTDFEARLFGRVSEILFNVWLDKNNLKIKEVPFMYMEKVDLFKKGMSFLMAKFFGKKYGQSF